MNDSSLKSRVMHSLKWVALGKIATQAIRWITTFWVIRMLLPEDYALVAMSDVVSGFLTLFTGAMFTASIIKDRELTTAKLQQVFGLIILFHAFLFVLQIVTAVPMGLYYDEPKVTNILYVNSVILLINIFAIIPGSLLNKDMEFKKESMITATSNIVASISTLIMAYNDFGFWAIIIGEIINYSIRTVFLLFIKPVFLLPQFRFQEIGSHIRFGGMLSVHVALFYILLHLDVFIAGRVLSLTEVGFYAVATQIALMPQRKLLPLLKQVAFPAFSTIQDDKKSVSFYILKSQRICFSLTIPIFWGLASVVDTVIPVILGDKWNNAILPAIIILSIMPLRFSDELFNPALKSQDAVSHMIVNVLIATCLLVGGLILMIDRGAVGLSLAWALSFPIAYLFILARNCKKVGVSIGELLVNFLKSAGCGVIMSGAVYATKMVLTEQSVLNLLIYIGVGAVAYTLTAAVINRAGLAELRALIRR
ncbi:lipopolysaccharide biosynthesis protein [Alteromonas sp. CYL-A6]|uniref:lipopolysaccharide biosynthesis protein n=1 Tax=Alteromonas nitratireducens TaxID=3390813 RepID=UPI0034AE3D95